MNVLVVTPWCDDLELENVKGTPENAYFYEALLQRNAQVEVVCPGKGINLVRTGTKMDILLDLYNNNHISNIIKKKKTEADVFISITGLGAPGLAALSEIYNVPFVNKYLGVVTFLKESGFLKNAKYNAFIKSVRLNPSGIIMTDDGTGGDRAVRQLGYNGKFLFLKNGYSNELLSIERQASDRLRLGFAATLNRLKGFDLFLAIFESLMEQSNIVFHVAGGGTMEHKALQYSKEFPDKFIYHGYLMQKDMPDFYKNVDVFFSLNRYANGTIPVVEAQAAGMPVIAFNLLDTKRFIKDKETGFLVEPFRMDSILFLVRNFKIHQAVEMGQSARQFVLDNFLDFKARSRMEMEFIEDIIG